jgi:hypothetical protein
VVLNKTHRRIAIIGSALESRNECGPPLQYDPPLLNGSVAEQACREIGAALAADGWDIVVYSGSGAHQDRGFIEPAVVSGYLSQSKSRKHSVHVHYAGGYDKPRFDEQSNPAHQDAFNFSRDPSDDWEPSFYRSLAVVDAALILGGGQSAYLAGLVCVGRRIPILALDTFGAAGSRVYHAMVNGRAPLTDDDRQLLAEPVWNATSAQQLVASLPSQQAELDKEREEYLALVRQRRRSESAGFALALFLVAAMLVPTALVVQQADTWFEYALLFSAPIIAGASGGTIRSLLPRTQDNEISTVGSAALGAVAGGIAGLGYIVSQVTSVPDTTLTDLTDRQYHTWVLFAVVIGFASGIALDAVFQRLVNAGEAKPRDQL